MKTVLGSNKTRGKKKRRNIRKLVPKNPKIQVIVIRLRRCTDSSGALLCLRKSHRKLLFSDFLTAPTFERSPFSGSTATEDIGLEPCIANAPSFSRYDFLFTSPVFGSLIFQKGILEPSCQDGKKQFASARVKRASLLQTGMAHDHPPIQTLVPIPSARSHRP